MIVTPMMTMIDCPSRRIKKPVTLVAAFSSMRLPGITQQFFSVYKTFKVRAMVKSLIKGYDESTLTNSRSYPTHRSRSDPELNVGFMQGLLITFECSLRGHLSYT